MSEDWDRHATPEVVLWGEPCNFAMLCFSDMITTKVKEMLKIGDGCGEILYFLPLNVF